MTSDRIDALLGMLRAKGMRMTTPRRIVLDAILAQGSHVTAEQLHGEIAEHHPELSLSTVYRSLETFDSLGVVDHVHLGHGPAEWHLVTDTHVHLLCDECGSVTELDESVVSEITEIVRKRTDFQLTLGHFALPGTCTSCGSVNR